MSGTHEARAKVLVVDDSPSSLAALEALLEPLCCELVSARSDAEAQSRLGHAEFAVALVGPRVPGTGLLEAARSRQLRPHGLPVPVVVLPQPLDPGIIAAQVALFVDLFRARERLVAERLEAQSLLRASEARLQALATLALALAEVSARDEVAAIVVKRGMRVADADTCTLHALDEAGSRLELIGHHGVAPEIVERLRVLGETEGIPGAFASMRSGTSTWAENDADYQRIFPQLAAVKTDGRRARASWSVPLVVEGSPIGLLGMGYHEPRTFPPAERSFVETFARQCAQALGRARRFEERERSEKFREDFVGMLGHDLRNPLSTILMTAQMMALRDELPPASAVKVRRILTSGERMHRMIEQLLDATRARTAGGIVVTRAEERDLVPLVARIVDELRVANQGRTIDLQWSGPVTASVDGDRLEQVLSNLLSNAIAHGDHEKQVTVTMRQDGDVAVIAVHNHGPPITPELMPLLFNPFARSQKHVGRSAGLGLGLYISERIVSAHGGRLDVESSAELGTRFEVRLPRRA